MLLSLLALTAAVACLFAFPPKRERLQCGKSAEARLSPRTKRRDKYPLSSLIASLILALIMCKCFPGPTPHYLSDTD